MRIPVISEESRPALSSGGDRPPPAAAKGGTSACLKYLGFLCFGGISSGWGPHGIAGIHCLDYELLRVRHEFPASATPNAGSQGSEGLVNERGQRVYGFLAAVWPGLPFAFDGMQGSTLLFAGKGHGDLRLENVTWPPEDSEFCKGGLVMASPDLLEAVEELTSNESYRRYGLAIHKPQPKSLQKQRGEESWPAPRTRLQMSCCRTPDT